MTHDPLPWQPGQSTAPTGTFSREQVMGQEQVAPQGMKEKSLESE